MNLDGRVAIVSGGARGIGLAIVEDLVAQGAAVVIVDSGVSHFGRDRASRGVAEEVARENAEHRGGLRRYRRAGVAMRRSQLAQKRFGAVDIVVNNAAIIRDALHLQIGPRATGTR